MMSRSGRLRKTILTLVFAAALSTAVLALLNNEASAQQTGATAETLSRDPLKVDGAQLSWEMPGRVSIYNLEFGPAIWKNNTWEFVGNSRTFNAGLYKDRLTLMVRFSYFGSRTEIPLKFVIKLPDSRQYDETVSLLSRRGEYTYHFTIHNPEDFLGSGSIYLYYGFSMVDVLDFTIVPGS